jgi:L-ascorbate metabolism protein UlaG (beta-lactamase superfamily)
MSKSSWFKLQYGKLVIHFDPGYSGFYENQGVPEIALIDKADIIFISHPHGDHLQPFVIDKISNEQTIIVGPIACQNKFTRPIKVVKPNEYFEVKETKVQTTDAYNTEAGNSIRKVHHHGDYVGFIVKIEDYHIYFAGDTDLIPEMSNLGNIDLAFIPIGGTYVMDIEEAADATKLINPKVVIPMHQASNSLDEFKEKMEKIYKVKTLVLHVGDKVNV